jgi:hypothetical protein
MHTCHINLILQLFKKLVLLKETVQKQAVFLVKTFASLLDEFYYRLTNGKAGKSDLHLLVGSKKVIVPLGYKLAACLRSQIALLNQKID